MGEALRLARELLDAVHDLSRELRRLADELALTRAELESRR